MGLFSKLYPDDWVFSAYRINYAELYASGCRGLIFDIDNTLVLHGTSANDEVKALFRRLHEIGYQTCLLSNNQKPRVKPFADAVGSLFLENAHKPSAAGYLEACRRMGTDPGTTAFVGDQLFTDIWGARRAGIRAFLVLPISPAEEIQVILKRRLEWIVLAFYRRKLKKDGRREIPEGRFQIPGRARITGSIVGEEKSVEK